MLQSSKNIPRESQILSACMRYLALHKDVAWVARMNSGGAYDKAGQYIRFGFSGLSDIIGQMKDGRFLAVEVKRPGGKLTALQAAFICKVKSNRGLGLFVTCVTDLKGALGQTATKKAANEENQGLRERP